jgi:hypothetical protein
MNSELVNFHLPTTGQFSAAVDTLHSIDQRSQPVACFSPATMAWKRSGFESPKLHHVMGGVMCDR